MGNRTSLFSGVLHLGKAIIINFAKKFFYEPDGLFYPVFYLHHTVIPANLPDGRREPESINESVIDA